MPALVVELPLCVRRRGRELAGGRDDGDVGCERVALLVLSLALVLLEFTMHACWMVGWYPYS